MKTLTEFKMNIRAMLSTSPPELDHVLPGLLAGSVGVIAAPGGTGKSMLLTQLALAIAAGGPFVGGALEGCSVSAPRKVVTFFAEETTAVMHHRLHGSVRQLFADMQADNRDDRLTIVDRLAENLFMYPLGGEGRLVSMSGDAMRGDGFRELLACCEGARLIVGDPLRRFHDGDENDSGRMTNVIEGFQSLAKRTGAAVLLAHHTNRNSTLSGTGDQASASRGSSALTDGVRWQANLSSLSDSFAETLGITKEERPQFIRLDISKANYVQSPSPVVLRRVPDTGALVRWSNEKSGSAGAGCGRTSRKQR
ncbi:helicase RepA family protein [Burkholderia sp. JPY481]